MKEGWNKLGIGRMKKQHEKTDFCVLIFSGGGGTCAATTADDDAAAAAQGSKWPHPHAWWPCTPLPTTPSHKSLVLLRCITPSAS